MALLNRNQGSQRAADSAAQLLKRAVAGETGVLDEAVSRLRQVIAHTKADDPDRAGRLSNLGVGLQLRFGRSGRQEDLTEAIAVARDAVTATRPDDPDGLSYRINLYSVLGTQVTLSQAAPDLDAAIAAGLDIYFTAPPVYPNLDRVLGQVAQALRARFDRSGTLTDLDKQIEVLRAAVAAAAPPGTMVVHMLGGAVSAVEGGPEQAEYRSRLGQALQARFELTARTEDLDDAIQNMRAAESGLPPGHGRAVLAVYLYGALAAQASRTGAVPDAEAAVEQARHAVAEFLPDDPDRLVGMLSLATALQHRSALSRQQADLDEAREILASAQALAGQGRLASPVQARIGGVLAARFELTGDRADLDDAVSTLRAAAESAPSDDAVTLGNLSNTLLTRFQHFGAIADLDEAITAERQALACTSGGPHTRAEHLSALSVKLRNRFWRSGRRADLDEAIDCARQALDVAGDEDYGRARYLTSLAGALHARYWLTGEMACLDEAISGLRAALAATPADWSLHPERQGNLGQVLHMRALRTGSTPDTRDAIALLNDAVAGLPDRDIGRAKYLAELGAAYVVLAQQGSDPGAFDAAIARLGEAVDATPAGQPDRCVRIGNLSNAYLQRYEATGHAQDLDAAISAARDALAAAPADHPSAVLAEMNLGIRLLARFELAGGDADLGEAITHCRAALAICPPGHPLAADCLRMLGDTLMARCTAAGDDAAGEEAFGCWRQAVQQLPAPASSRVWAAISWGQAAAAQRRFELAEEGFGEAVGLLPLLAWGGLDRRSQELALAKLPGIASDAAACAIAASHHEHAVELLEHGRSVLWSQLLRLRGEHDELRAARPELADRLAAVRAALNQAAGQQDLGLPPEAGHPAETGPSADLLADLRMRQADEWDRLVAEIQELPGFAGFLESPPFAELAAAVADGPVVILNASNYRCDALALTADGPIVVPLLRVTREEARTRANAFLSAIRMAADADQDSLRQAFADASAMVDDVLGWLAEEVTTPVLAALQDVLPPRGEHGELPRIWWCPTGPLSVLPIHAAGPPWVTDQVVSSYTPTLRALRDARHRPAPTPSGDERMLLVTMPGTAYLPGGAPLPGASDEADVVARRFLARMKHLTGPTATRAHVVSGLTTATFAHFACHAAVQPGDPSAGGLYLADGPLTISQLSHQELAGAALAFLSACESATGSVLHLDESISMAAATQLAGFRHVIGTMWYLADTVAPDVAQCVYDGLAGQDGGQPAASGSAQALHAALEQLRAAGCPTLLWAPYIHIGP
jgi:tetratricopeptide (TPR) repeat protein